MPSRGGFSARGSALPTPTTHTMPPSEGAVAKTVAGKQRQRSSFACDHCSKKKSKCDNGRPVCSSCAANGLECTYTRQAKRRGPAPGYFSSILDRLKQLETKVADTPLLPADAGFPLPPQLVASSVADGSPSPPSDASHTTDAETYFGSLEAQYAGGAGGAFGIPSISPPPDMSAFTGHQQQPSLFASPSASVPPVTASLPFNNDTLALALAMSTPLSTSPFAQVTSAVAPVSPFQMSSQQPIRADLVLTFLSWSNAKLPIFKDSALLAELVSLPPALTNAIYALASTAPKMDGSFTYNLGDNFFFAAKAALDESLEKPSVHTVAACILLAQYAAGSGRGTSSTVFVSTALRVAQQLKLDRESDLFSQLSQSSESIEFRRRLWYALYETDFYTSFATDMPFLVPATARHKVLTPNDLAIDPSDDVATSLTWLDQDTLGGLDSFSEPYPDDGGNGNGIVARKSSFTDSVTSNGTNANSSGNGSIYTDGSNALALARDARNIWRHMIKLQELARRVVVFVRMLRPDVDHEDVTFIDEDMERAMLDSDLQQWFDSLPVSMQAVSENYSEDTSSTGIPPWRVAYMQCLFHYIRLCLHEDVVPRMAEQAGPVQIPAVHPSLLKSREQARLVTQILSVFMRKNPFFHHVPQFISRIIYHTGLMHILLMRCMDADLADINAHVDVHVQALKNMSTFFLPASHHIKFIEAFRAFPFRPVKTKNCPKK
ncbi:hypothetical protein BC831DRAFT_471577 [Entophlyctis helioformis]|nr:hypothetical protein BC831DRAFT_471577 [Entophlyctis helioformis]